LSVQVLVLLVAQALQAHPQAQVPLVQVVENLQVAVVVQCQAPLHMTVSAKQQPQPLQLQPPLQPPPQLVMAVIAL